MAEYTDTRFQEGSHSEWTVSQSCFKVRAENEAGVSSDSEMSDPITTSPPPLPGRPGKPTASKVTHNSIRLNWPAPTSGMRVLSFTQCCTVEWMIHQHSGRLQRHRAPKRKLQWVGLLQKLYTVSKFMPSVEPVSVLTVN